MTVVLAFVSLALATWGALHAPQIDVDFFQNDIGALAQTGCPETNHCLIAVYEPGWNQLSDEQRRWLIHHEVGHTLGLDHYGSCNANLANMGCWWMPMTDFDRVRLESVEGRATRIVVPVAADGGP